MKKKITLNIFSIAFVLGVHALLCFVYHKICFLDGVYLWGDLKGVLYIIVLVFMFLLAPVSYYISGRIFTRFANKKFYITTVWVIFSILSVLGVVAIFKPELQNFYLLVNSPSYMYYLLFKDSVIYISVPAMAITGLFPAMFSRNGYVRKKRQKNEITMDELNERINSANEETDELEGYDEIVEVEKSEENEES
ncbi:MAG: hypothetical protein IKJ86_00425 [Clostridia bacterium]|nr:hypothetical protein [Clostridia bacterium]